MIQLLAVFLQNDQLLIHPPDAVQVSEKRAELFPDFSCYLVDLLFTVFPDPITDFDDLISLEDGKYATQN
jgi:hypothetical protein